MKKSKFYSNITWLVRFFCRMGVRPSFFILPTALSLVSSLCEGLSVGLLIPAAKGIIDKDFGFMRSFIARFSFIRILPDVFVSDTSLFVFFLSAVFCASLLKNILDYFSAIIIIRQEHKVASNIRKLVFGRYLTFGKLFFDRSAMGSLAEVVSNFSRTIAGELMMLEKIKTALFTLIVYIGIMFMISWKFTAFVILMIPLISYSSRWLDIKIRAMSMLNTEFYKNLGRNLFNVLSCIVLVKLYNSEERERGRFNRISDQAADAEFDIGKRQQLLYPLQNTLLLVLQLALVSFMALIAIMGRRGDLAEFIIFLYALRRASVHMAVFGKANASFAKMTGPVSEISRVLDDNDKFFIADGKRHFEGLRQKIELKNLNFSYLPNMEVLKGITFSVEKGKMTAIVGPTGAGKTTIINLILRLYECPSATIFMDGVDIRDFSLKSLRGHMALVSQHNLLFNDTIRFNITYALAEVNEEKLIDAVKRARLYDFIMQLPEGLDTCIGDRGVRLSGGESQRVSIARALLKGAEILILDEATSSLDTKTERLIQEAIDEAIKDRTSIVIAHRLSTIKNADKIIAIENGRVIEEGTLQELLAKNGAFYEYWTAQKFY